MRPKNNRPFFAFLWINLSTSHLHKNMPGGGLTTSSVIAETSKEAEATESEIGKYQEPETIFSVKPPENYFKPVETYIEEKDVLEYFPREKKNRRGHCLKSQRIKTKNR